jgi:hypothetical protein
MPLIIAGLERAVRSWPDLRLLEHLGQDDRYFLTFTPPGGAAGMRRGSDDSAASGWRALRSSPLPWQAARHAGSVRVCLR